MNQLNPEKLFVSFGKGITPTEPIFGRKYTLTHSDQTAELFLDIRTTYATDKITSMRDEVTGTWFYTKGPVFYASVLVDTVYKKGFSEARNQIFVKELPLALDAIRFGDRAFFTAHPGLDWASIFIQFHSGNSMLKRTDNYGTFSSYR